MQFQEKLMNQTWKNGKKPNFRPGFSLFCPNLDPKNFLHRFYRYEMLDIVTSCHCIQFQGKLIIQTQENGKKPHFGPDLVLLGPNSGGQIFSKIWLCQSLDIMVSYYVQYQNMIQ